VGPSRDPLRPRRPTREPPQPAGQRGADEGDILIAEFDLTKNLALLRLGDDELLEEMSPEV